MQLALQQYRVNVFKVMAHPLRLQILELLCEGPKGVYKVSMSFNHVYKVKVQQFPNTWVY